MPCESPLQCRGAPSAHQVDSRRRARAARPGRETRPLDPLATKLTLPMALFLVLAGAYLVVAVLLWALQEQITFPAPRGALPDPQAALGYGERIELIMKDGTRLAGWYLPPEDGEGRRETAQSHADVRRPTPPFAALLWFYGNGETIGAIWPVIRDFRPPNAALLVLDYPGYGASGGRASEAGIYEVGALAY